MKYSIPTYDTLQIALNKRINHCTEVLTNIIVSDFKVVNDDVNGDVLAFDSKHRHFSVVAYKAMLEAKNRLEELIESNAGEELFPLLMDNFNTMELTQMVKAVGSLQAEHQALMEVLVNALVNALVCSLTQP